MSLDGGEPKPTRLPKTRPTTGAKFPLPSDLHPTVRELMSAGVSSARLGRPKGLPELEAYAHGTRARYVAGCRCDACRKANTLYARTRARAQVYGGWNGNVDAAPVRAHLLKLSRAGVGKNSVARAAKVPSSCIDEIRTGKKTKVRKSTAEKILAVTTAARAPHATVSAARTKQLIAWLLEEGFTESELARRLGSTAKIPHLQFNRDRVLVRTAKKVEELWRSYQ